MLNGCEPHDVVPDPYGGHYVPEPALIARCVVDAAVAVLAAGDRPTVSPETLTRNEDVDTEDDREAEHLLAVLERLGFVGERADDGTRPVTVGRRSRSLMERARALRAVSTRLANEEGPDRA